MTETTDLKWIGWDGMGLRRSERDGWLGWRRFEAIGGWDDGGSSFGWDGIGQLVSDEMVRVRW